MVLEKVSPTLETTICTLLDAETDRLRSYNENFFVEMDSCNGGFGGGAECLGR